MTDNTRKPSKPNRLARRGLWRGALALALFGFLQPSPAQAGSVAVPEALQIKLLAKVAKYDRNLPKRAGSKVKVLVLRKQGQGASELTATKVKTAINKIGNIAGISATASEINFSSPAALVDACKKQGATIVYLTPGLAADVPAIAKALAGVSVLTVSAVPKHVQSGAVLGFDLVEGKPKILVHLKQAKQQQVSFLPAFLRLAKIVVR